MTLGLSSKGAWGTVPGGIALLARQGRLQTADSLPAACLLYPIGYNRLVFIVRQTEEFAA
jgi:hypothetical protein